MEKTRIETLFDKLNEYETSKELEKAIDTINQLLQYSPNDQELHIKKVCYSSELGLNVDLKYIMELCKVVKFNHELYYHLAIKLFSLNEPYSAIVALACSISIKENEKARESLNYVLAKLGFKKLSIYFLMPMRIGHLSMEPDSWLRQQQLYPAPETLHLFISCQSTSNKALSNMISRYINLVLSDFYYDLFLSHSTNQGPLLSDDFYNVMPYDVRSSLFPNHPKYKSSTEMHKNVCEIYSKSKQVMDLSQAELIQAKKLAKEYQIKSSKRIVCLHTRDSAYLGNSKFDFSYHDYRDVNINNYKDAIEYLLSENYQVIRIGTKSNQILNIDSPDYIDLNQRDATQDISLLELYIIRECYFYWGITSGPLNTACIFDKPILCVNGAPYFHYPLSNIRCRAIFKKVQRNNEILNFIDLANGLKINKISNTQIIDCSNGKEQKANNIEYIENTSEEILEAIQEFLELLNCQQIKLSQIQENYLKQLPVNNPLFMSNTIPNNSFLKKNKDLFNL